MPGTSAFMTPMLTTGNVIPVLPSVRCRIGPFAVWLAGLASNRSVWANTVAAPAHTIGFTMNSRRFHSRSFFMTLLLRSCSTFADFWPVNLWQALRRLLQNLSPILRWLQQYNHVAPLRPRDHTSFETILCPDSTFSQFRSGNGLSGLLEVLGQLLQSRFRPGRIVCHGNQKLALLPSPCVGHDISWRQKRVAQRVLLHVLLGMPNSIFDRELCEQCGQRPRPADSRGQSAGKLIEEHTRVRAGTRQFYVIMV